MSLDVDRSELRLPEGYRVYEIEGHTMLGDYKSEFNINKNRSFKDIDDYFSNAISRKIEELRSEQPDRKLTVLDLAGGIKSQAVKDLNRIYDGKVKAVNLDMAHSAISGVGALRIQGDAVNIPLADSSVDVTYCRQFLPFIKRFRYEHSQFVEAVLEEVARVLKPGGVAFLDDEEELSGLQVHEYRRKVASKLGVVLEPYDSGSMIKQRKSPKFWQKEYRPAKFLVMKKI